MINIQNKEDCCGCNACGDVCSKQAIIYNKDSEGFWYPEVDKSRCVDCGLCEKVCPIITNPKAWNTNTAKPRTFVLQHKDVKERFNSTSGCLYPEIARYYLENGGYVAGHIFNPDYTVRGYITSDVQDLDILRNSKYLQSDLKGVFKEIKKLLGAGKEVLFSGCPCQVAGLKSFLRKDYPNLLTIDFVCMGIDSPKAFLKYIESLEGIYGSKVKYFKSKSKETGWRDLTNKFIFDNGKTYFGTKAIDANLKATFLDVLVRPACYSCKFKGLPRISDITIGDFWRRPSREFSFVDDNTGTSYYLANSKKAEVFIQKITDHFEYKEIDVQTIIEGNPNMIQCLERPSLDRNAFYDRIDKEDYCKVVDDYFQQVHKQNRIKKFLKNSIRGFKLVHYNPLQYLRFLYYNIICSNVEANLAEDNYMIISPQTRLSLKKRSKIKLKGICMFGDEASKISLAEGAVLTLNKVTAPDGGVFMALANGSEMTIGYRTIISRGFIAECTHKIRIGGFSYIGNNVIIKDNETFVFSDEQSAKKNEIDIGEHCYIGNNSTIRKGSVLNDEVAVSNSSTIAGAIPPRVRVSGNPAKIVEQNILWKI